MKTILLFHRLELADLFVPVGAALEGRARILHLAYGNAEVAKLRALGVTGPIPVFKDAVRALYPQATADADTLAALDVHFVQHSGGAFNLNGAIQSDRGFTLLSLEEANRLTIAYHRFWTAFLADHQVDAVLHETCSLMLNFTAAMALKARGGHYLYPIMARGPGKGLHHLWMDGFDFTCPDLDHALAAVASSQLPADSPASADFLTAFRQSFDVFLGGAFQAPPLWRLGAVAALAPVRRQFAGTDYDRVIDNIDYWMSNRNEALKTIKNRRAYSSVDFASFDPAADYVFYPLHLEPEAVVLYHAHGFYRGQVKLVENIAAQLPAGIQLYVKDHPHHIGYRAAEDYQALARIPNIRLLDAAVPGKAVTAHARGLITLTGTAGFEAMLLGKPVFTLGKAFYSAAPGVTYVHHIRDLRVAIAEGLASHRADDSAIRRWLAAYFAALRPGLTDYFAGRATSYGIDLATNATEVANGLLATMEQMG